MHERLANLGSSWNYGWYKDCGDDLSPEMMVKAGEKATLQFADRCRESFTRSSQLHPTSRLQIRIQYWLRRAKQTLSHCSTVRERIFTSYIEILHNILLCRLDICLASHVKGEQEGTFTRRYEPNNLGKQIAPHLKCLSNKLQS